MNYTLARPPPQKDKAAPPTMAAMPPTINHMVWSVNRPVNPSTRRSPTDWEAFEPGPREGFLVRCFLHAWLKIRDRAKNLKDLYFDLSTRVWDAYHASDKRSLSQRLRRLRAWAGEHLSGVVLKEVEDLCDKKAFWLQTHDHPEGHRTSNALDRVMRPMNRYFFDCQHLHGKRQATRAHVRGWALLWNFTPWNPATTKTNNGWNSLAERLNQHRYHDNWLENLMISASLGGHRKTPQKQ